MIFTVKKDKAPRKCCQSCKLKEVTLLKSITGLFKFFKKNFTRCEEILWKACVISDTE